MSLPNVQGQTRRGAELPGVVCTCLLGFFSFCLDTWNIRFQFFEVGSYNSFAGLAESPGQTILFRGRSFKQYRGMGSLGAMNAGSADRYHQDGDSKPGKLVPEGVEGRVPFKGPMAPYVFQLVGGLRAGMGYVGARTLVELRTKARFIQVTGASVQESHPHDIAITQEAPNYSVTEYGHSGGD